MVLCRSAQNNMCRNTPSHCQWTLFSWPNLAAVVMGLHLLASASMRGADADVLTAGQCSTTNLVCQWRCVSFEVSKVEFRPFNDAYYTTKDLCQKFGNPIALCNSSQCLSGYRDIMFNYTDSNNTWVFSLHMRFAQSNEAWKISFINFTNATKPGVHSYIYSQNLQRDNDFYASPGQAYKCDMVSFMDDRLKTGITFKDVMVQPFGPVDDNYVRYCHNTDTTSVAVGIAIGTIVGAFVLLALVTVVIILVYRRLRYGNYNLLDS